MRLIRSATKVAMILASLALSHAALASTYYIDSVSGSDGNNGDATHPKQSVAGLTGTTPKVTLHAGDVVNLRGVGPYNVPGTLGRDVVFDSKYSGTSGTGNEVTVQSDPAGGKQAVFDPGFADFMSSTNTAWVPCTDPGAHPDEYVSVNAYPALPGQPQDGAHGAILDANGQATIRLLSYSRVEDFRATNESFAKVPYDGNNAHGRPIWGDTGNMFRWAYRGPGLWLDPATNKIHFRGSSTHWNTAGVTDYVSTPSATVGTDPRNLAMSVSLYPYFSINVFADYLTFKNIVIQNGGAASYDGLCAGVGSDYNEHVTFDHCYFYLGRNGFKVTTSKFTTIKDSVFDGKLPSWVCRSDVKDNWDFVDYDGVSKASAGTCRETQVCLFQNNSNNEDLEIANCEFRNGHDGVQMWGIRPRFHHNLLENLNDEAIMFYGSAPCDDTRIYNNVIRKATQPLSSSEGSSTATGARYVYRNVIDERYPVLGYRQFAPDTPATWRIGEDFKMNTPFPELYVYQNTFVMPKISGNYCTVIWGNIDPANLRTRRFMNNIYMAIQDDATLYGVPNDPTEPNLSNGNNWHRRITNATTPELVWFNAAIPATTTTAYNTLADFLASSVQTSYVAANGVGWETNSRTTYPQFANVQDYSPTDGGTFFNADYRVKSTSPDRYTGSGTGGVTLPPPPTGAPDATHWPDSATYTTTPDVGALPYGSGAVAVGVDGARTFPDSTTPIAEAGDYSVVSDSDQNGFETVSFDASGSSAVGGATISGYSWSYNGAVVSTGSSFSKDLPIGTHQVYLTVTDSNGKTATDMRQVTVTDPAGYDNLVRNPGLEGGSTSWTLTGSTSVVSSPTHYGVGAMKLVGQSSADSATQEVPVVASASTKVSCWVKTDSLPSGHYATVQLQWLNSSHAAIGSAVSVTGNIGTTTGWTYYTTTQSAPSTAAFAVLTMGVDAGSTGGTAYFDDARVMVVDSALINGFMEKAVAMNIASSTTGWKATRGYQVGSPAVNNIDFDQSVSHSGAGSLKLTGNSDYAMAEQLVPVNQGQTYHVEGWVKTVGMPGSTVATLQVYYYDAAGTTSKGLIWAPTQGGTVDWAKQSQNFTIPTGTGVGMMKIVVKIDSAATGGVTYFDDLYVK